MCGRFVRRFEPVVYAELFGLATVPDVRSYNVAPTQKVVAVRGGGDRREAVLLRWGLIPSWAKDAKTLLINARAETITDKPAFRMAFKKRRCLIAADGYYEWKHEGKSKQPYLLGRSDRQPVAFAGIWERWLKGGEPVESCAIITTSANDLSRPIHDRMPVILPQDAFGPWLDPDIEETEALLPLLQPCPAAAMTCFPVSNLVNSARNDQPECIDPAA